MAWDNIISRITWLFLQPSNLFFFLLLGAVFLLWKGHKKAGLSVLITCLILYFMVMVGMLTHFFMAPLEKRFAQYTNRVDNGPYSGIIVLGGGERIRYSTYHHQVTLNGAGERLIEAAKLARMLPSLPIIFCGGGSVSGMMTESDIARKFFIEAGIDPARVRFDDKSYNSYTNALEAKKLIKKQEIAPWFLVTSAFHMPRAVGAYRKAGIAIQPYPVDYRTDLEIIAIHPPNMGRNLYQLDYAIHEWVGLFIYYIMGHNEELYPTP